ncbi:MAG: hypothetical protein QNJ70_27530 [Xenococcaceae cyanobacterium MO_207.B15]|nr:hypothetical protein [Xenococcaceae cyanobacterium MO_207.B15]MDJ0747625.1 hypothetical protein [Xenococcaceae cyanobacterium MO_167.B27]
MKSQKYKISFLLLYTFISGIRITTPTGNIEIPGRKRLTSHSSWSSLTFIMNDQSYMTTPLTRKADRARWAASQNQWYL